MSERHDNCTELLLLTIRNLLKRPLTDEEMAQVLQVHNLIWEGGSLEGQRKVLDRGIRQSD
jgi:hypothetical protein